MDIDKQFGETILMLGIAVLLTFASSGIHSWYEVQQIKGDELKFQVCSEQRNTESELANYFEVSETAIGLKINEINSQYSQPLIYRDNNSIFFPGNSTVLQYGECSRFLEENNARR